MITESIEQRCYELLTPIITKLGYEVVEIAYKASGKYYNLIVYIYKQGGISLDDCELVSKAIDGPLDEADITEGKQYNLSVSSPGLDRLIVTDDDFRRNVGTEVEALLIAPMERKKKMVGVITAYDDGTVTLDVKGSPVIVQRNNIKSLKAFIRF